MTGFFSPPLRPSDRSGGVRGAGLLRAAFTAGGRYPPAPPLRSRGRTQGRSLLYRLNIKNIISKNVKYL